jgi:hypothetical protein
MPSTTVSSGSQLPILYKSLKLPIGFSRFTDSRSYAATLMGQARSTTPATNPVVVHATASAVSKNEPDATNELTHLLRTDPNEVVYQHLISRGIMGTSAALPNAAPAAQRNTAIPNQPITNTALSKAASKAVATKRARKTKKKAPAAVGDASDSEVEVLGPSAPKKKGGRAAGSYNYTAEENSYLLTLVRDVLPIGQKGWKAIANTFNIQAAEDRRPERDQASLKQRFMKVRSY